MMNIELNIVNKYAPFHGKKRTTTMEYILKRKLHVHFPHTKLFPKDSFKLHILSFVILATESELKIL